MLRPQLLDLTARAAAQGARQNGRPLISHPRSSYSAGLNTRRGWTRASSSASSSRNLMLPPIRNSGDLKAHLSACAANRLPLITLWTASWCATCRVVTPMVSSLVESGAGEAEGGVAFCLVDFDSSAVMTGQTGSVAQNITSIPTLLALDTTTGIAKTGTREGDAKLLASRRYVEEWIKSEAKSARAEYYGGVGGNGSDGGGTLATFGGLFNRFGK